MRVNKPTPRQRTISYRNKEELFNNWNYIKAFDPHRPSLLKHDF
jgi:hypothetical protein